MEGDSCCHPEMDGSHTMAGIPDWLYYPSIVIVMLLSVIVLEFIRRKSNDSKGWRFSLSAIPFFHPLLRSRYIQSLIQMGVLTFFLIVCFAGFYGNQHPGKNIAPTLTWNIWWVGLIFAILFAGKIWCYCCPWDALTSWLRRLAIFRKAPDRFNLGLRWPSSLKNIYPATVFFVLLTWLELGFHVTISPSRTALLGIIMFTLVFIPGLIFEKKAFCRYGCLVGRISGLYAMFAPVEIRRKQLDTCRSCRNADCFKGNENGHPCPTGLCLKTLDTNTYCTMCMECLRTCPHDNVSLNLRFFGADLTTAIKTRKDEASLALILFALTAFHGFTMTPHWMTLMSKMTTMTGFSSTTVFTLGMIGANLLPLPFYLFFVGFSRLLSGMSEPSTKSLCAHYAYGLIPIALFYHIAHNVEHFFMESQKAFVLISDPFGFGWNIFGTAELPVRSILSLETIWILQVILIVIGHVFGLAIAHKQAYRIFPNRRAALFSQIPMIALMVLYSLLSLWLVAQPMEMRTAM